MTGVSDVVSHITDFAQFRRVDFENELLSYLFKKNGVIPAVSLHPWLGSLGMNLSNRDIQQLVIGYAKNDGVSMLFARWTI
jgi:hypothetical protein